MSIEEKYLTNKLTRDLIAYVMEDFGVTMTEAMSMVYYSELYAKILDTETGLYYQSSGYNYEMLKRELQTGTFV
ncbi:MAG: hypothetical protein K6A82_08355 [Prevotella sp.]|nr:hypothetical protein [Prevotella sp.]